MNILKKHFRRFAENARSFFAPGRSQAPLYIFDLNTMRGAGLHPIWAGLGVFISMERCGMDVRIWTDHEDSEASDIIGWLHVYTGLSKKDLRQNIVLAPDYNPKTEARLKQDYFERLTAEERARLQGIFTHNAIVCDVLRDLGATVFLLRNTKVQ